MSKYQQLSRTHSWIFAFAYAINAKFSTCSRAIRDTTKYVKIYDVYIIVNRLYIPFNLQPYTLDINCKLENLQLCKYYIGCAYGSIEEDVILVKLLNTFQFTTYTYSLKPTAFCWFDTFNGIHSPRCCARKIKVN